MLSRLGQLARLRVACCKTSFAAISSRAAVRSFPKAPRLLAKSSNQKKFCLKQTFDFCLKKCVHGSIKTLETLVAAYLISQSLILVQFSVDPRGERFAWPGFLFNSIFDPKYSLGFGGGPCMKPTLCSSEHLFIEKRITKEDLQVGMVICFTDPQGLAISFTDPINMVKRLIALGPCEIERNGKKHRVPEGFVWVEGDNAENSYDSRYYGPVPVESVLTQIICSLNWLQFDLRKKEAQK